MSCEKNKIETKKGYNHPLNEEITKKRLRPHGS